ncbi:MAG: helix-turn-helix domain-containing protein [Gracilibacteraceae bacterium]|jgi:transcriptional regulator with XRE-family HTH domain|nr:helix-turn-helix domain-containing protein [Gracilibacteraceae bacterium]
MNSFAEKVKLSRELIGMSQKEVAEKISVSIKSISAYERGLSEPRGTTLHKLARALNISVDYLMNDDVTDPRQGIEKDPYVEQTREMYGNRAAREAEKLLEGNLALFAGGQLDQEELDSFFEAVTEAYWAAKREAKKTYGRKKPRY